MIPCPNPTCGRHLNAKVMACPACGTGISRPERVGDYVLLECVAESRTASIFRARMDGEAVDVCLRLYNPEVALSPEEADRLRVQFDSLRELPEERIIHTLDSRFDSAHGVQVLMQSAMHDVFSGTQALISEIQS